MPLHFSLRFRNPTLQVKRCATSVDICAGSVVTACASVELLTTDLRTDWVAVRGELALRRDEIAAPLQVRPACWGCAGAPLHVR